MISVTEATATILSLSPNEPAITLALSATLSITQSRRGDVKTCCQPVDSFTLKQSAPEILYRQDLSLCSSLGTWMSFLRQSDGSPDLKQALAMTSSNLTSVFSDEHLRAEKNLCDINTTFLVFK